ncbi:DUF4942 domain-containing protein [Paraburkholderia tropica]|uniref:DUF4942 domain-containing protein n=1 Tax=Paraburkholderia tropica TaxID=92647 RepID=UPI002AB67E60|nr:DUF4942 domain-containing protein [Paraburkholderia tropica]
MTELVKSVSVENLLRQRDAIIERIAQAKKLIDEAEAIGVSAGLESITRHIGDRYSHAGSGAPISAADFVDSMSRRVDASAWAYLMRESGLRTFMDATARAEWDKGIHELKTPALNVQNVMSTFQMLHDSRGELFERGVIACFRSLSWRYKTNTPFKFGKRLILTRLLTERTRNLPQFIVSARADSLDDLVRVFNVCDGKPEPDHRGGMYTVLSRASDACADLEYFSIKWFKNGNAHLTFKRPDLVERLNRILVKHFPNALACENA